MSKWISVEERTPATRPSYSGGPETSGPVIVFNGYSVYFGTYEQTFKKREWRWNTTYAKNIKVTHWMPLPEPPK